MRSSARHAQPALDPATTPPEMTDAEAVREVVDGNREMFEVIVRRYNQRLYRIGMGYLQDHAETEDAMQNAYVKAFLHLGRFRGNAAFATWLTRIMINECLMVLRSRKRAAMESLDDEDSPAGRTVLSAPAADTLLDHERRAVLEHAVRALPLTHRTVYLLRDVQHLSTSETARALDMSTANVKVCLHRAREELKAEVLKSAAGLELFSYPAALCDPMTARVMQVVLELPAPRSTGR